VRRVRRAGGCDVKHAVEAVRLGRT